MTVVAPPFFFEFIQWITERAEKETGRQSSSTEWQPQRLSDPSSMPTFTLKDAKPKRKASAANRRYAAAFKKCKRKHMKKNGGWKKGGFKRCVKEAHRMAKR